MLSSNVSGRVCVEEDGPLSRHFQPDVDRARYRSRSRRLVSHVVGIRPVSDPVQQRCHDE